MGDHERSLYSHGAVTIGHSDEFVTKWPTCQGAAGEAHRLAGSWRREARLPKFAIRGANRNGWRARCASAAAAAAALRLGPRSGRPGTAPGLRGA